MKVKKSKNNMDIVECRVISRTHGYNSRRVSRRFSRKELIHLEGVRKAIYGKQTLGFVADKNKNAIKKTETN